MATYLIINLIILIAILVGFRISLRRPRKNSLIILGCLLLLTAVFDTILIIYGMVAYNPERILGIKIGAAPIEDFFYPLVAFIIIPVIWKRLEKKHD